MAQIIRITNLRTIPGADNLLVTLLEPFDTPVVVGIEDFHVGDHAIFLPVGTILPADLLYYMAVESRAHGVVERKNFRGQTSEGLLLPLSELFHCGLVHSDRRAVAIATGQNVGGLLGCTSVNGTAHFSDSLTAEVVNATGEVVGLFSKGQILAAKIGKSHLVGPLAENAHLTFEDTVDQATMGQATMGQAMPGPGSAQWLKDRIDEFGEQAETASKVTVEADELAGQLLQKLVSAGEAYSETGGMTVRGMTIGVRAAGSASLRTLYSALIDALGEECANKLFPFLQASIVIQLSVVARNLLDGFYDNVVWPNEQAEQAVKITPEEVLEAVNWAAKQEPGYTQQQAGRWLRG